VVDLATKYLVVATLPAGRAWGPFYPLLNAEYALGAATTHPALMVAVMVLVLLASLPVAVRLTAQGRVSPLPAGLILGGAVGNTIDRAVSGAVHDFLAIGQVVVINVADVAVVAGLVLVSLPMRGPLPHARE
jgi:signal peptidase II